MLNEPKYFSEFDLNEHSVLAALLIDSQDFARMGVISRHFLRQTSPQVPPFFKNSGTRRGARGGESSGY